MQQKIRFFIKQNYFNEGENTGHHLAVIARAQQDATHIEYITTPLRDTVSEQTQIALVFTNFFKDVYTSKVNPTEEALSQFLDQCPIPRATNQEVEMLNAPLKLEELSLAVSQMANSKDGLPIEVYKRYSETFLPSLLETLNDSFKNDCLPDSMGEAVVVVLPKPGKDPQQPYRPISLLNSDVKLLAQVLASRLVKVISRLVYVAQSGFIPA